MKITKKTVFKILELVIYVMVVTVCIKAAVLSSENKMLKQQITQLEKENNTLRVNNETLINNNERFQMIADESYELFLSCLETNCEMGNKNVEE